MREVGNEIEFNLSDFFDPKDCERVVAAFDDGCFGDVLRMFEEAGIRSDEMRMGAMTAIGLGKASRMAQRVPVSPGSLIVAHRFMREEELSDVALSLPDATARSIGERAIGVVVEGLLCQVNPKITLLELRDLVAAAKNTILGEAA